MESSHLLPCLLMNITSLPGDSHWMDSVVLTPSGVKYHDEFSGTASMFSRQLHAGTTCTVCVWVLYHSAHI